ncbi:unannotated protein [freshwater metagenome]|uniref:Unannotated protein n=1 Tax=freshwater metagenome TaxID=449393 RepID=A0A6J7N678_9ZZZZ
MTAWNNADGPVLEASVLQWCPHSKGGNVDVFDGWPVLVNLKAPGTRRFDVDVTCQDSVSRKYRFDLITHSVAHELVGLFSVFAVRI